MTDAQIKVVEVLNDRELAISAGSDRGIVVDTVLRISGGPARQLTDPDTGEVLGEILRGKAVVRVYDVAPKFALARTFRMHRVNRGGNGAALTGIARIFEAPQWESVVETLHGAPDDAHPDPVLAGDAVEVLAEGQLEDMPTLTARG